MSKLLKCPFCGCKNIQFWEADNETNRFQIVCMQCFNGTDECISEEVAIEKWNRRTPMVNIVEKLEELKKDNTNGCEKVNQELCNSYLDCGLCLIDRIINIVKQEINNGLE